MINLRDRVRDQITGYKGIVIGITTWMNGCRRITVQAEGLKDGKPIESQCFDEPQLEVVKAHVEKPAPVLRATGGPIPAPRRRPDVVR